MKLVFVISNYNMMSRRNGIKMWHRWCWGLQEDCQLFEFKWDKISNACLHQVCLVWTLYICAIIVDDVEDGVRNNINIGCRWWRPVRRSIFNHIIFSSHSPFLQCVYKCVPKELGKIDIQLTNFLWTLASQLS